MTTSILLHDCEFVATPIPNGSVDLPFTQQYLDEYMRTRRKRLAMHKQKSADECRIDFLAAQVKKARMGRRSRCSKGIEREINRIVRLTLEDDLGV